MNPKPLRLLLLEGSKGDDLLVKQALIRYGFELVCTRVSSAAEFSQALRSGEFDLVLCDYETGATDAHTALEILRGSGRRIPLMVVCRNPDKSTVVELMRRGADHCVSMEDLDLLGPAVERLLKEPERAQKWRSDDFFRFQTEVLEMIVTGVNLPRILETIALRIEVLLAGGDMCSIMLSDQGNGHLKMATGPGLPGTYLDFLGEIPIRSGAGSCGTAAATGNLTVAEDIGTHPDWEQYREVALRHGLRSCWSVPVRSSTQAGFSSPHGVLGTLSIYRKEPHVPGPEEVRWVESAARLVGIAVERFRMAEKLQESEALLRFASSVSHSGTWRVDLGDGRISWSDEICAMHEVPFGTVPDLETALGYHPAKFRGIIRQSLEMCLSDGVAFDVEAEFTTASGKHLWMRSIGECSRDSKGQILCVQGALQDITARKIVEMEAEKRAAKRKESAEIARATEQRYLRQRNALIALAREAQPNDLEIAAAFQRITETTAKTLDVELVSIWRYTGDRTAIECLDEFRLETGLHSSGGRLVSADYPAYFKGLEEMELIAADNAHVDPSTRDFFENYLKPAGIGSMLDVPIRSGETVEYLLCNEHVGAPREWTADEKTFAVAIANLITLALESAGRALAQQEVLRSHRRFQSMASATNDTIWDWNLKNDAFWWNDGHANLFGWSSDETGATSRDRSRQIHAEDRKRVEDSVDQALRQGDTHWSQEYRFLSRDGSLSHVLDRGQVIFDEEGKPIRMVGGMTDLTASKEAARELDRTHRALRMLISCNEMLIRAPDGESLLQEACNLAVEIGGYRMAWVGYALDDEKQSVQPKAHAGHELGYLEEVEITWADDHSSGIGPVGQAIRGGRTVVFEDVVGNPAFYYWLAPATKRGYRSVVCLPLHDATRVFGVFCLYGANPHPAGTDEVKLLQQMANDLAFGIVNIRERELRQRTQEVVVKVAQAVSSGTGSEFFHLLTGNMVEAMGALGGLVGRYNAVENSIETISYILDGKLMQPVSYSLIGTPCEKVLMSEMCVFDRGVQQLFPEDHFLALLGIEAYAGISLFHQGGGVAGIMAVLFANPLKEISLVESTLKIFATRAASELDRQQSDARIREQASLLDKARDAIIVRDLNHRITFWNKSAERLYGWSAEEALGQSVMNLIYRDRELFEKAHEQMLVYDEWQGEMQQMSKDGRPLTIEGRWTLVRDEKGRPESVFVLNSDISEQRKLEHQFLRAQRIESIGTLAGGIAHDLNNILAPISMSIELLKMRVKDPRSNELLDTIAASSKRGSDMVGQVLSFARGMEGRRVEVHPRQLIREIENILRDTLLRKVDLTVETERSLWTVDGDPTQLHQVILNLCMNARDAIPDHGKIMISARNIVIDGTFAAMNLEAKEGPHVCIEVEDTGEGIRPEIIDKIFDPFFTTKSVGKGTGLGLSTSLAIVKSHGGFIRTTSRPKEGTRFRIYLPAIVGKSADLPESSGVVLPAGNGETVLIVDDESSIRRITQQTLEAYGYRTLTAANGDEAISCYRRCQAEIDIVLTDMMMPVMDGSATIELLKEINPKVRIIATSGITANRQLADGEGRGTRHFLPKPYNAETLLTCLQQVLASP